MEKIDYGRIGPNDFRNALDGRELVTDPSWALAGEGIWECDECRRTMEANEWIVIDWDDTLKTQNKSWHDLKLAAIRAMIKLEELGVDVTNLKKAIKHSSPQFEKVVLCAICAVEAAGDDLLEAY